MIVGFSQLRIPAELYLNAHNMHKRGPDWRFNWKRQTSIFDTLIPFVSLITKWKNNFKLRFRMRNFVPAIALYSKIKIRFNLSLHIDSSSSVAQWSSPLKVVSIHLDSLQLLRIYLATDSSCLHFFFHISLNINGYIPIVNNNL